MPTYNFTSKTLST